MIGTHNSYTFLPAKNKFFEWFSFLWRTQTKNIIEQKKAGVTYFDIRVRRDKANKWRICHGIVDFAITFDTLREIADLFSGYRFRLILERNTNGGTWYFRDEILPLVYTHPSLTLACIKKGWEELLKRESNIVSYAYTPWLSGESFWSNIKRFNFFSTIKRWAKKHNPVITDLMIKSNVTYFMDYV